MRGSVGTDGRDSQNDAHPKCVKIILQLAVELQYRGSLVTVVVGIHNIAVRVLSR